MFYNLWGTNVYSFICSKFKCSDICKRYWQNYYRKCNRHCIRDLKCFLRVLHFYPQFNNIWHLKRITQVSALAQGLKNHCNTSLLRVYFCRHKYLQYNKFLSRGWSTRSPPVANWRRTGHPSE